MATIAIELNDAGLAVAGSAGLAFVEPGYAALVDGSLRFGDGARAVARLQPRQVQRRYWNELDDRPLAQPLGACRTNADLVQAHLAHVWERCRPGTDVVILAVPAGWSAAQLGLLLGIAMGLGIPVTGMVDSAVAASRQPWPGQVLWHLDATLHGAILTRIEQETGATVGQRELLERPAIESLERTCAEFFARCFVTSSRFDPLHDARAEQALYDQLGPWLATLGRTEAVLATLEHNGRTFTATVTAVALAEAIALACQQLIQRLRALVPARGATVLQVASQLTEFPGFIDSISHLPGCTVVALEPGAAARGALRSNGRAAAGDGLRLVTTLPFDRPPTAAAPGAAASSAAIGPTHVLFDGRAYRLGRAPFQIGAELGEGDFGVRLDGRTLGVSRRHCTIRVEDGRVLAYDQSRYGTLLNGHRIDSVAVLQAGDVLGVGQPPLEFRLIAEVTDDGA